MFNQDNATNELNKIILTKLLSRKEGIYCNITYKGFDIANIVFIPTNVLLDPYTMFSEFGAITFFQNDVISFFGGVFGDELLNVDNSSFDLSKVSYDDTQFTPIIKINSPFSLAQPVNWISDNVVKIEPHSEWMYSIIESHLDEVYPRNMNFERNIHDEDDGSRVYSVQQKEQRKEVVPVVKETTEVSLPSNALLSFNDGILTLDLSSVDEFVIKGKPNGTTKLNLSNGNFQIISSNGELEISSDWQNGNMLHLNPGSESSTSEKMEYHEGDTIDVLKKDIPETEVPLYDIPNNAALETVKRLVMQHVYGFSYDDAIGVSVTDVADDLAEFVDLHRYKFTEKGKSILDAHDKIAERFRGDN